MRIASLLLCALMLCSSSITAQGQRATRPTPDVVARAMVETALPADWADGFDNLGALSEEGEVKESATQMAVAASKFVKPSDLQASVFEVIQYRAYIRPLFKGRKVQIEKLKQYNSRLTGLSPEAFGEWSAALKAKCKDTKDWMAAYEVSQVESFWSGDKVTDLTRKRTLTRLASVTGFDGWSPAENCSDNVMYLLQTESLFDGDRFDADLFAKALPLANRMYKERSARRAAAEREKK